MKLKCIIIDDEPIARKVLREYIHDVEFLELAGEAANPMKALPLLENQDIDLVFLDIQMPVMNGIDFLKVSRKMPMTVITSAFSEYALEGYELDVIDYLVKPIPFERFLKACNKVMEMKRSQITGREDKDYFFIRCGNRFEKILFSDILFVEAAGNYVFIQTREKRHITYLTFKGIEEELPPELFMKVHKSYIVALNKIDNISAEDIRIGKHSIPLSRNLKDEVLGRVLNKRLFKR